MKRHPLRWCVRPPDGYKGGMARAVWSGSISFGLVNVPVKAYTAVRDHEVHFNQLERKSGARIRYEKVSEKTGKEVPSEDIELGYEVAGGRYVTVDPEEIDSLRPKSTRSVAVSDFVELARIDPIYYERTYWLAPDGEASERAYRLLLAAMESSGRAGIGMVVMRNKQYLAAVRPLDGALAVSTMRFADEVVPKSAIDQVPTGGTKADAKELRLATQIIDSLATEWDPARYHDTYTEELKDLLERKAKGEHIVVEEPPATQARVVDLMAALEASIAAAKKARGGKVAGAIERAAQALAEDTERKGEGSSPTDPPEKGSTKRSGARKAASTTSSRRATAKTSGKQKSA
jgi:DNA end-binding protein Ku